MVVVSLEEMPAHLKKVHGVTISRAFFYDANSS
jgi:hypothetical protein